MKNVEAFREVARLSTGTQATIFGTTNYKEIDSELEKFFYQTCDLPEGTFADCENWQQVIAKIKGGKQ